MENDLKSADLGKHKNEHHYRQAFKIKLLDELVSNEESISFIARKNGMHAGSLFRMKKELLTELGYYRILDSMKKNQDQDSSSAKQVEELQKALELATMKVAALETLIDVAEDKHNIDIRKKTGSKQSK